MIDVSDTWTMSFDDAPQRLELDLDPSSAFVARVVITAPVSSTGVARELVLVASGSEDRAVRTMDGRLLWCHTHRDGVGGRSFASAGPVHPGGLIPRDHGGEALALSDGRHLLDWLCPSSYVFEATDTIHGQSPYGSFTATVDPDHRFVSELRVSELGGSPLARLSAWKVVPREERWFSGQQDAPWFIGLADGR